MLHLQICQFLWAGYIIVYLTSQKKEDYYSQVMKMHIGVDIIFREQSKLS